MHLARIAIAIATLLESVQACNGVAHSRRSAEESDVCPGRSPPPRQLTAITNVHVFDGYDMSGPQTIWINGEYIERGLSRSTQSAAKVIDGTGKFLLPGLIDSHAHPMSCGALANYSSYGVTTVNSMACFNYTMCATMRNQVGVADFRSAGLPAIGLNSQHQKSGGLADSQTLASNASKADLVFHVTSAFGNDSNYMKITAEPNGPTQDQQNTLVQLVHALGRQTMTHAAYLANYRQAISSNTDGIQHLPADGHITPAMIAQIKAQNQFITPTLMVGKVMFSHPAVEALLEGPYSNGTSYDYVEANIIALRTAGVPMTVGTDAVGNIPGLANIPFGLTTHCELQNFVEVGFSNAEALRAATINAAALQYMPDRGSVSTGKRADLLLLNSNPLENIANTGDIAAVWANGVEVTELATATPADCAALL